VPQRGEEAEEDEGLLGVIQGRKQRTSLEQIGSEGSIIRYDVLKEATNNKARSRRSSRFKLEKELEDLKFYPHPSNLRQHSHNNFGPEHSDHVRTSCHDFSHADIIYE
jgi:hypothetical protein